MVAPSNGPRESRAPVVPPAAAEVYAPGDVVRHRLFPDAPPEIILWVERHTGLFSHTIAYFTVSGPKQYRRDPAEVVRISPSAGPDPAAVKVAPRPPAPPFPGAEPHTDPESIFAPPAAGAPAAPSVSGDTDEFFPPPALVPHLHQAAPEGWVVADHFRVTSPDGRFAVEGDGDYHARDLWTGEQVGPLKNPTSAFDWCRNRLKGAPLKWEENDSSFWARDDFNNSWNVYHSNDDRRYTGYDNRPGRISRALRSSPRLATRAEAQAWCEVRAACVVEPGGTLRYDPAAMIIPF